MKPLEQEKTYSAAYSLYQQGDYQAATQLFRALVFSDAFNESYWRGLASSHQMQTEFQEALQAWALVALLSQHDPYPHFHAAECLLSLKELEEGQKALNCAETLLTEAHLDLRDKITLLKKIA
jgi:type III secretion system low calcium response chaperone LcrH/SycD